MFTNVGVTAANSVDGGAQADAIYVGTAISAVSAFNGGGSISGGDGADTISLLGFGSAGSIIGGAGADSISFGLPHSLGPLLAPLMVVLARTASSLVQVQQQVCPLVHSKLVLVLPLLHMKPATLSSSLLQLQMERPDQ